MARLFQHNLLLTALVWLWVCVSSALGGPYPVKGATSGIHPRLEIRTLRDEHPSMFNLYILALQAFQKEDQNDLLSWYQIGGIHGEPNIAWNGVEGTAGGTGYCVHGSTLFPIWHRPYVALFEERLSYHAKQIAKKFKGADNKKYTKAAKQLRSPYWDWAIQPASGQDSLPDMMTSSHITVHSPSNGKQSIKNPLYSYHYHPLQSEYYASPWSTWHSTLRYPAGEASNAKSQESQAINTLNANRASTQSQVYQFFTNCKAWLEMSNDNPTHTNPGCSTSLEGIHNNIHGFIGGYTALSNGGFYGGHMTVIPYSGHEPSFFLHHTQIDRLLAMWQVVYPSHWVAKGVQSESTYIIPAGTELNRNYPLYPFHQNAKGDFWTADSSRNHEVFGYTYPDLQQAKTPKAMRAQINKLYGPDATAHADKRDVSTTPLIANNGSAFTYNANIVTSRFKLGNSYNIYAFLGEPTNQDATTWGYDPNSAGTMAVFAAPGMTQSNILTSNYIPLTLKLAEKVQNGELPSLAELDVVPYLTKNLNFKIVGPTGILDASQVPDFNALVVTSTLAPAVNSTEFGNFSPFVELPHIAPGLVGGLLGSFSI